jgi:cbb3-type cytochrome oxidase maturation protein
MSIIFVLIALSLMVAILFLMAFFWAIKSGQFDDDYTPSLRILFDNDKDQTKDTSSDFPLFDQE